MTKNQRKKTKYRIFHKYKKRKNTEIVSYILGRKEEEKE